MTLPMLATTIGLPWSLQVVTMVRIGLTLAVLVALWPYNRFRPKFEADTGPYLIASFSLMVSYWVLAGVVLVAAHLLNPVTVLLMAALPRLLQTRRIRSRYGLRWDVKLVESLEPENQAAHSTLGPKTPRIKFRTLLHHVHDFWRWQTILGILIFGATIALSLWLRLDTVLRDAAPFYQNAPQNLKWIYALAHSHWLVGGHPIPLGSFILVAEVMRVGFINPLMLEKLAASLVFLGTSLGLLAVCWSITRNIASVLAVLLAYGLFSQWLSIPLARELAVGPTSLAMMGTIPAFWLMYSCMRTGSRVYGMASLGLVLMAGVTNPDAGVLTAGAALIGWIAVWLTHPVPWRRIIGWLSSLLLASLVASLPMLLERVLSHQWALPTTMFPLASTHLNTPRLSALEVGLLIGTLAWMAIRIWIEDYGAAFGVLLLLVLALGLQEASVWVPVHFVLAGTRQLLALAEALAIGGVVALFVQDLITLWNALSVSLVSLAAVALTMLTGLQPMSTYTMRSNSFFYAYARLARMEAPYSWIAVSSGGTSMVAGSGYHMDPLQWTARVSPKSASLLYKGSSGTRPITQHQIFFFVERRIHTTPLTNNQFTVLREQIRNQALKTWLSQWHQAHPHTSAMTVFFQSPQLTVYQLSQGSPS